MATSTVKLNGTTLMTVNDTTAVAADVAQGKVFTAVDGTKTTGTASSGSAPQKQVNFIDYDGTILYSYTAQEANALSALPANPSHSGLTAQGWNWTLQEIKAQLTAMPDGPVWVGQMYITASGDTEIDVKMLEGRLSPILTIAVNGTVTVDWGDNTTADTVTGSSLTTRQAPSHTYAAPGDYTIKIHVVSGSFSFYGSSSYLLLRKNENSTENQVYSQCVQSIRLGSGITSIGYYAFYYCRKLAYITMPSTVTSISDRAFYSCTSLASITIPDGVTSIGSYAFNACTSLLFVAIPPSVTSVSTYAFVGCSIIVSVVFSGNITSIENYTFQNGHNLASIILPSTVTSIGISAFQACYGLVSLTIPSTVTSIGNNAFNTCAGMKECHIKPTSVPTLGTTVFAGISSDCVIYVPTASLDSYKTATNWSTYASYMQGE